MKNLLYFLLLSVIFSSCSQRFDYKISEKNFENGEKRYALVDSCGTAVTPYIYTEISEESEINGLRRLCYKDSVEVYLDKRGEAFFKIEKESDIDKTNKDFFFIYENTVFKWFSLAFAIIFIAWFVFFAKKNANVRAFLFLILVASSLYYFAYATKNRDNFKGYELVTNKADNLYGLEQNGKLVLDVVYSDAMDYDKMITMLRTGDNKRIFIDEEQNMFVKAGSVDEVNKYVTSAYKYPDTSWFSFFCTTVLIIILVGSVIYIIKEWY